MAANGIGREKDLEAVLGRIRYSTNSAEVASNAQFIVEAVFENLDLKQDVFKELDSRGDPEAILATNTSVISITDIA